MELLVTTPLLRARSRPRIARPGANPTLALVEVIRDALRRIGEPVSRNWLLAQLAAWGHATNRPTLNAALRHLMEEGSVGEGTKGIIFIPEARGTVLESILKGRKL